MKIGILTYHCGPNFGAQLQAVSTVGYIKKHGHEPIVLNWYPQDLEDMYSKRIPKKQIECHAQFTKEVLPVTKICRTGNELIQVINQENLDAIFVGSDALFKYRPKSCRKYFSLRKLRYVTPLLLSCEDIIDNPFFGDFISQIDKSIPVSAFSVSSQNCNYPKMNADERKTIGKYMQNYTTITVRDEWTKNMVEDLTNGVDIKITPDPVFSFNQNCYIPIPSKEEIIKKYNLSENYVLLSFSDWYNTSSYIKGVADELESRAYLPVALPMPEKLFDANIDMRIELPLSPIDWYALIKYSSGYIGERMHPIIVSLHNNVPFVVFDEYGTIKRKLCGLIKKHYLYSSKTYLILHHAGLESQLYSYFEHKNKPSAKEVVDLLDSFDKKKCEVFSSEYQRIYEDEMNEILKSFK